jgi:hypothetical protein
MSKTIFFKPGFQPFWTGDFSGIFGMAARVT